MKFPYRISIIRTGRNSGRRAYARKDDTAKSIVARGGVNPRRRGR